MAAMDGAVEVDVSGGAAVVIFCADILRKERVLGGWTDGRTGRGQECIHVCNGGDERRNHC